jgi:4'-phosphopantetheinyl transferase
MYKLFIRKNISSENFLKEILKKYHINYDIFYNEYGKPYIKNNPIYFNISNCDDYTVIVISDREVGVDIQKITIKPTVIDKVCNDKEKSLIKTEKDFTRLWVKKEAYVKCLGIGLSYGLKNVDTTKLKFKLKKYKNYYIGIYIK